jgi:hypothetical protein
MRIQRELFLPVAALVALGLAACSQEQEEAGETTEVVEVEEVTPTPQPVVATLETVGGSAVGGEVQLTPREGQIGVLLMLDGATEGERYVAHLHRGTCEQDLGIVTAIGEVTVNSSANRIEGTIDPAALTAGEETFVQLHRAADNTPLACTPVDLSSVVEVTGAKTSQAGETY